MDKKRFFMIGYTHIDPVWLWNRAEGMQEVKSSFASALARMEEFPDFKFTQTSIAFLAWLKENCPEQFEKIKERVEEGRWEIAGGMWIEPDCNLPSGEALIRQFLYGKDFVQREFGREVTEGFNPDSFGHGSNLPAIFAGCGLRSNTVSRPAKNCVKLPCLFNWQAADGSRIPTERTGGEYMAWTRPTMEFNIKESAEGLSEIGYDKMAVFYGVGNHGGGPTIENIRALYELRTERGADTLDFAAMGDFYECIEEDKLPTVTGELGRIYFGCYSSDRGIKAGNRRAEWTLLKAEAIAMMASLLGVKSWSYPAKKLEEAWKRTLFCQFHDILAGTSIETARDAAVREFGASAAMAEEVIHNGVQAIANAIDTRGDGFPLLLVNPTSAEFDGVFEAEVYVPRAPKKPLRLRDPYGAETYACESWYHNSAPESRKTILFQAQVPAYGYAVYRVLGEGPNDESAPPAIKADLLSMDNGVIRLLLDEKTGLPSSLKKAGKEMLSPGAAVKIFYDDRGAWGETIFCGEEKGQFQVTRSRMIEDNALRAVLRVFLRDGETELRIDYIIEKDSDVLKMSLRLENTKKHRLIALCLPVAEKTPSVFTETAFLAEQKIDCKGENPEYYQHRFADLVKENGSGLAVLNDSVYGCMQIGNEYRLILARSAVHARGGGGPLEEDLDYAYMDQGVWDYECRLIPHEKAMPKMRLFQEADLLHMPVEYLGDSAHQGMRFESHGAALKTVTENAVVSCLKESLTEPGNFVLRVFETEGKGGSVRVWYQNDEYQILLSPWQIKTVKWTKEGFTECDLLERQIGGIG